MPIKIPDNLPAKKQLVSENIFVMTKKRAVRQDMRPLKILILNLMPLKISTETHLLRVLGNTPLQVEPDLLITASYQSKNTPKEHLQAFYKTFEDVSHNKYDGMIITGAPVEHMDFEEVDYWKELTDIMDWTKTNVTSTLHICWAAQAALYHHYGVPKYKTDKKVFGVFPHEVSKANTKLLRGFDDEFYVPHSRHTEVRIEDVKKVHGIDIFSVSKEVGLYICASRDRRQIFATGHSEYDALTLHEEYIRDKEKGLNIDIPKNYYKDNDPSKKPVVTWRSNAHLLFSNWLNYYVYQETPYNIDEIT